MSSISATHSECRSRFEALDLAQVIEYDNAPFDQPQNEAWIRWHVRITERRMIEFGSVKTYKSFGSGMAQIFTPLETGDAQALELANTIEAQFRMVTVNGVHWLTPTMVNVGRVDKKWWQVNVICPFWEYETL